MKVDFDKLRISLAKQYNRLFMLSKKINDIDLLNEITIVLDFMHDSIAILLCCESDNEKINAIDFELLPRDEEED